MEPFAGNVLLPALLPLLDLQYPPFPGCYNSTAATVFNSCKTSVTLQLALWPIPGLPTGKENISHA
jgi:hypothetical protein